MYNSEGIIFDISRFCVNDGPGIRTTVFLKGCPLHCSWCHNPEGISPRIQLSYNADKCTFCGKCAVACPNDCHSFSNNVHRINFNACVYCGICSEVCEQDALNLIGRKITVREVVTTVLKDLPYYRTSSGGVTLSGGEILFQPEFSYSLLQAFKDHKIHTCIETSGIGKADDLKRISKSTDLVLFDFKHSKKEALYHHTGADLNEVYHSLEFLSHIKKPIILRCPLIEDINISESHIDEIARLANSIENILQIDLLPYHNLYCEKARKLLLPVTEFSTPSKEKLSYFIGLLQTKTEKIVRCEI